MIYQKKSKKAIKNVKKENYKNYFMYAYKKEQLRKPSKKSTRRKTPKNYKK